MNYFLISDIHANLEALEAVLAEATAEKLLCLGDAIGYGPDPAACIEILRRLEIPTIMGNHERVQLNLRELASFNALARHAALFTQAQLSPGDRQWLATLPAELITEQLFFSHGAPYESSQFYYLMPRDTGSPFLALSFAKLERLGLSVAFMGHTHVPGVFSSDNGHLSYAPLNADSTYQLEMGKRYIINCPSVGQPRNGNPAAQYLVYDVGERQIHMGACAYDLGRTAEKMRAAGLPEGLWERLYRGR